MVLRLIFSSAGHTREVRIKADGKTSAERQVMESARSKSTQRRMVPASQVRESMTTVTCSNF